MRVINVSTTAMTTMKWNFLVSCKLDIIGLHFIYLPFQFPPVNSLAANYPSECHPAALLA